MSQRCFPEAIKHCVCVCVCVCVLHYYLEKFTQLFSLQFNTWGPFHPQKSILQLKSPFSGCSAWSLGPWSYQLGISLFISLGLEAVYGPMSNS